MSNNSFKKWQFVQDLLVVTLGPVMLYFLARRVLSSRENYLGDNKNNPEITRRLEGILADREDEREFEEDDYYSDEEEGEKRSRQRRQVQPRRHFDLKLSSYEQSIASEVVKPASIPVTFDDIGGLDNIISELQEAVIYPLTLPGLYKSSSALLSAPSGVLLYGPPGCGKTMLAKALARESGAVFINLHISTLTEKWFGDSNKLVAAVFSLARKLAPAIVFVDEIDAVFGSRRSGEHEASGTMKAEMMTHWDGLASADADGMPQQVLILGATNRPQDIDEAILRRMPKRFAIGLPDVEQRRKIFKLVLRDIKLDEGFDGDRPRLNMDFLVNCSAGMSGSDIKEVCREAAMAPMREYIQGRKARGERLRGMRNSELRGLRTEDFFGKTGAAGDMVGEERTQTKMAWEHGRRRVAEEVSDDSEYETLDEDTDGEKSRKTKTRKTKSSGKAAAT